MLAWTEKILKKRTYQVAVEDKKSEKMTMKRGVPQGSCLSPTIFNIMVSDIPHLDAINTSEFADDLAISATADNLQTLTENLEKALRELEQWANKWNLLFNPAKTKALCFTKKKNLQFPTLKIHMLLLRRAYLGAPNSSSITQDMR